MPPTISYILNQQNTEEVPNQNLVKHNKPYYKIYPKELSVPQFSYWQLRKDFAACLNKPGSTTLLAMAMQILCDLHITRFLAVRAHL